MSVRSAALQATCAALGFVLTIQSATAALHHAHKHHHKQAISQCRPWDANAAVSQPADSWWTRLINGAESAPAGH
jgi:hypothetical protein